MALVTPTQAHERHRRPQRLGPGSRVAVIAPSSGVLDRSMFDQGVRTLEHFGLEVLIGSAVHEVRGYLAGEDHQRAEDLLWALSDETIDGIWCARGGYGAQRTVASLDMAAFESLAERPPKAFIGFSDITALHALITSRLGWITFYGPGISKLSNATDYTLDGVRVALFEAQPFKVEPRPGVSTVTTLVNGTAEGILAGGCLPRLANLVGTSLQVNFDGKICFFEDVSEAVMEVDGNLTQMIAAGCFDGCVGIVIGDHVGVETQYDSSLELEQVFGDLLVPLDIPCCYYLPIGHGPDQATLPIGATVQLDADNGILAVLNPAVA
nr:LD-carboxypeptidase [Ferrimicrobium acidiphilum]